MSTFSRTLVSVGATALTLAVTAGIAGPATAQPTTTEVVAPSADSPFAGLGGGATSTSGADAADSPFAGLGGGATGASTADAADSPFAGLGGGATATGTAVPTPTTSTAGATACPKVQILAVQGTGESSATSATDVDSGMLGRLVTPVMLAANEGPDEPVARAYVPYAADFGFKGVPYAQSMTEGLANLEAMTVSIHESCPDTKFVYAGFSQGGDVADQMLRKIGQGDGPIDPDLVAAGVLFSSPTREAGTGVLPGTEATSPAPVPGTSGDAVSKVDFGDIPAPEGGGISPTANTAGALGALEGRVASFCVAGDLACDTPKDAPIARMVANIAGQADLSDPVAALTSIGTAVGNTALKTAGNVVNEDVSGDRIDTIDYNPKKSISRRLAEASDPRTPMPDPGKTLTKLGTIGLNSLVVIAKKVLTPANIIQLAAVGMANPPAALALLGTKVVGAVGELITPATGDRLVQSAFRAVEENVEDNKALGELVTDTKYWEATRLHGSYGSTPTTPTGDSAVTAASTWITAVVADVVAANPEPTTPLVPLTTATAPKSTSTSGSSTTAPTTSRASGSATSRTQSTAATSAAA